jgi:wobble nucleotide-excising tRNase
MIHKVERLVSIGKFRSYQATGDVSFRKLTLFYAENGTGKTTLTAVFRSLTLNKPDIIIKRISTNAVVPQAAQIIQRDLLGNNSFHTYRPTGWSNLFPDIEIFDIHFVNENIYSGFDFNEEHKKQLHEFVIGAQGVAIKQQIEQNKFDKSASRQRISVLENDIIQQVGNGFAANQINTFLNLSISQAENIDDRIIAAETALSNARANSVIQTLQTLSVIQTLNCGIDFEAIKKELETTTETIQDIVLQEMFNKHCADLTINRIEAAETWLQTGFDYLSNKKKAINDEGVTLSLTCPFCQQPVNDTLDIFKAYTLRFNESFNNFIQRIQNHLATLVDFNLDAQILLLDNINQMNTERIISWVTHLPTDVQPPIYNIIFDNTVLKAELQSLINLVQQKLQNPSEQVSVDSVNTFQTSIQAICNNITIYNQSVTSYNNTIISFRTGIQTERQAQEELNRLNIIKKRFEPVIGSLCISFVSEKQNLRALEQAYTQLVQQEQASATAFFSTYKDRINYYLGQIFKTPFQIDDVVHIPPQGRAIQSKIGYKLTIDGQDVSFDPNQPNCAKDCLSEGDKSSIALAFFLAKMDIDPGRADKVLVFDDPLSSFDSNRRLYTVQLIRDLFSQIKQIIVLSHNEYFLYEVSKGIARGDTKTLRISENFVSRSSKIEPLNLDDLVEIEYFKHIKELEDFLQNADINQKDKVLGHMRNILEAHIRFKFYRQISAIPENSRTFGNLINELVNQNVVFRNDTNPPSIIIKLRLINAISCKPHHGEPIPYYRSIGVDPNTITVGELANFVQDTLDLIDNRL